MHIKRDAEGNVSVLTGHPDQGNHDLVKLLDVKRIRIDLMPNGRCNATMVVENVPIDIDGIDDLVIVDSRPHNGEINETEKT